MVTAFGYMLNTIISYFGYEAPILSHLLGLSLFPWLFLLLSAIVFKFCIYHRMFLYYILIVESINLTDYYIGIPLDAFNLFALHMFITGIMLFLILYLYVTHHKKPTI